MARRGRLSRIGSLAQGFNDTYDTIGRVMTDIELGKIAAAQPEEVAPVESVDFSQPSGATESADSTEAPVVGIKRIEAPKQYRFLGKTYDKPLSDTDLAASRLDAQARAIAANDPLKAQQLRQAGLQTVAAGMQIDTAKREQEWRKKTADTVSEFEKGLADAGGKTRQPTQAESYDLAVKLAGVNQAYGHGAIFDRADALNRAKKMKDENFVEALRYAHAGDKENAIKRFNEFGDVKITDLNLEPTTMNIGGVQVPTYAISATTADGKTANIPNAYGALIHGLSFENVAKGEELGLKRRETAATEKKADAAVTSAAADASRATTAKEVADQARSQFVQGDTGGGVVTMPKGGSAPTFTPLAGAPSKPGTGDKRLSEVKEARAQLETGLGITRDPMGMMTNQGGADMNLYNDVTSAMDGLIRNGMSASQAAAAGRKIHDTAVKMRAAGSKNPVGDAITRISGGPAAPAAASKPTDYSTLWK